MVDETISKTKINDWIGVMCKKVNLKKIKKIELYLYISISICMLCQFFGMWYFPIKTKLFQL